MELFNFFKGGMGEGVVDFIKRLKKILIRKPCAVLYLLKDKVATLK